MKVLTIWEPSATLYAHGIKKIETRPKPTSYKGIYLIHAAIKWTKRQKELCLSKYFFTELLKLGYLSIKDKYSIPTINIDKFKFGHIIGAVDIKSCARINNFFGDVTTSMTEWSDETVIEQPELSFGDYTPGRYAWIGENHRILKEPIPYKGSQGYYSEFKGDESKLIFE